MFMVYMVQGLGFAFGPQRPTRVPRTPRVGLWFMVWGVCLWFMVSGFWFLLSGLWFIIQSLQQARKQASHETTVAAHETTVAGGTHRPLPPRI
jgi:hypothetical protein